MTTESFVFNNQLEIGKFFPQHLGISFPLSMNYNMQNNSPKFFPGTDIRTNAAAPDSIIAKSSTIAMVGKISKKIKSENPFIRYTIDNLSANFNASKQNRSDEIMNNDEKKEVLLEAEKIYDVEKVIPSIYLVSELSRNKI